jgi:hypothetical protein
VDQAEGAGYCFQSGLHHHEVRGLLLQECECTPDRIERRRTTCAGRAASRSLDLKQCPHGLRNGLGDGNERRRNLGIGLKRG